MPLPNYLANMNLAPEAQSRLASVAGINADPVSEDEIRRYMGTDAAQAQQMAEVSERAQSVAAPSNPSSIPGWTPEKEQAASAQYALEKAREGAPPVAPPADQEGDEPIIEAPQQRVVGYSPAHWQDTARTSSSRSTEYDPERLAAVKSATDSAMGHGMTAGDKQLAAAKQQAEADVAYSVAHEQAAKQAALEQQRINDERRAYVDDKMTRLNELSTAASAKVDPELAKGSLGAQVLGAIGVALGQFGASINGGQNTALQIVNANIDRNIRAQEVNIANAKQTLRDEESLYRQNLEMFGDREKAVLATKMAYLDQAKALSDQLYAKSKGTMSEAQKAEFDQKLWNQRGDLEMKLAQSLAVTHEEQGSQRFVPGQAIMAGAGGSPAKVGDKGKDALYVPALGVYARTEKEAIEMRTIASKTQNTVRELEAAQKIIAEADKTYDPRKLRVLQKKLDGIAARAAVTATVKEGQGAMSEGDRAVSDAGLGLKDVNLMMMKLPGTLSAEDHTGIIGSAMAAHKQEYGRLGSGQQRGKEVYVRDPATGNLESRRVLTGSSAPLRNKVDDTSDLIQGPVGQSSRKK